jgi:hypothetical protein
MMNFSKLAVLGVALAAAAPFASADTITLGSFGSSAGLYNPGTITVSNTQTQLIGDELFTSDIISSPPTVYGLPAPVALSSFTPVNTESVDLNPEVPTWNAALANSSWVGINEYAGPQSTQNPEYGYYEFQTTFSAASSTDTGMLTVAADDTTEVFLNGTMIIPFGALGTDQHCADNQPTCSSSDTVNITAVAGTNTLTFVVEQAGSGPYLGSGDPSGLDFDGSLTTPAPTPEPNSLILLGTGLCGAAGMLVRKRQAASL